VHSTKEQFLLFRIYTFQDPKAFELLLNEYGSRVQKYLRMKLPRLQDAEDVYSESCLRMWNYTVGTKIDAFAPVLNTIARSAVADFYRTKARKVEMVSGEEVFETVGSTKLEQSLIDQLDVEKLKLALAEMAEDESQVIIMRYLEQLSIKEIGQQIGKSENATSVMLHRAIHKLRQSIEGKFGSV
jgi:RNA polymerase sigma-70 factor (ECF subfamily)